MPVLLLMLAAAPVGETISPLEHPPERAETKLVERPSAAAQTGAHLAFTGGVIATSLLATAIAYLPGILYFSQAGRPEPLFSTALGIPAAGVKVAVTYWLLPELYRVGGGTPDIDATRQAMWRLVRWPAIGAAVSIALLVLGAGLEHVAFGKGQGVMIAGLGGLTISATLFDIFSIIGSSQGYRQ